MKRLGMMFRDAPHLHSRKFRPGDCGQLKIPFSRQFDATQYLQYPVIVRLNDCMAEDGSWDLGLLQQAPAIPFTGWGLSGFAVHNVVKGVWQKHDRPGRFLFNKNDERWFDPYWTRPIYIVEKGLVYRGTQRSWDKPC